MVTSPPRPNQPHRKGKMPSLWQRDDPRKVSPTWEGQSRLLARVPVLSRTSDTTTHAGKTTLQRPCDDQSHTIFLGGILAAELRRRDRCLRRSGDLTTSNSSFPLTQHDHSKSTTYQFQRRILSIFDSDIRSFSIFNFISINKSYKIRAKHVLKLRDEHVLIITLTYKNFNQLKFK